MGVIGVICVYRAWFRYLLDIVSGGHGVICVYRAWFRYLLNIVSGAEWGSWGSVCLWGVV